MSAAPPLFVLYVPGLDRRRVTRENTPFVYDALARFPNVALRTLPTTELVPTLFTGTWPHEHGIWQVKLRRDVRDTWAARALSLVPDAVTTTVQGVRHVIDGNYDLATVPWRRRRRFELRRFKYTRRTGGDLAFGEGRGVASLFDHLGERGRYLFTMRFSELERLGNELPSGRFDLELLEMYAFDVLSHWNLDRPDVIRVCLARVDEFVRRVAHRARERGVRLMLLVDHGQELVRERIDLRGRLRESRVPGREYDYFLEVGVARLWFHTERARRTLLDVLRATPRLRVLGAPDLRELGIDFPDDSFGEAYVIADHGVAFFPHDYYQPLANVFLGLTHDAQRPRVGDPRHRGSHGQHPDHESETGYLCLLEDGFVADREESPLVDFAPTVLALLGRPPLPSMGGRACFRESGPHGSAIAGR